MSSFSGKDSSKEKAAEKAKTTPEKKGGGGGGGAPPPPPPPPPPGDVGAPATNDFPTRGVRLSYFNKFIAGKAIMDMTTTEVCTSFVKPATEATKCSFIELLDSEHHPDVGEAQIFISHAWKYKFLDVVSAMKSHFKKMPVAQRDPIVWFDLFCNNQHKAVTLGFDWWCNTFMQAIKKLNNVVMIFSPWGKPTTLTRAWCLFEAYCCAKTDCKFEVAMSDEQRRLFFEAVMEDAHKNVNQMLADIDCQESDCFIPEDKEKIFEVVEREVGFGNINSMVFEQLRNWVIKVTREEMESVRDLDPRDADPDFQQLPPKSGTNPSDTDPEFQQIPPKSRPTTRSTVESNLLRLENSLGDLYEGQTKFDKALECFQHCFDGRKKKNGPDDPATLLSEYKLADILRLQREYDKSEPLHLHALERRKTLFGEKDQRTLQSKTGLANLYVDSNKCFDESEALYKEVFDARLEKYGEENTDTLMAMNNLGAFYHQQRAYDKAYPLYEKCLEIRRKMLGNRHPDSLLSMNNLASLHERVCRYAEAEELFLKCLEGRDVRLGKDHLLTLDTMDKLAVCYREQNKFSEAISMHDKCMQYAAEKNLEKVYVDRFKEFKENLERTKEKQQKKK